MTLNGTASASAACFITQDGKIGAQANAKVFTLHKGITYKLSWHQVSGTFTGATTVSMVRVVQADDISETIVSSMVSQADNIVYYTPTSDIKAILAVWVISSRTYTNYKISISFGVNMGNAELSKVAEYVDNHNIGVENNKISILNSASEDVGEVTYTSNADGTITLNGTASSNSMRYITNGHRVGVLSDAQTYKLVKGVTYNIGCIVESGTFGGTAVALMRIVKKSDQTTLATIMTSQTYKYISYTPTSDIEVYLAIYAVKNRVYTSYKFTPIMYIDNSNIVITPSMFETIGVIGDSFASGISNESGEAYAFSWLQMMAREYGCIGINFSTGNLTTRTWLTNENGLAKLQSSDACDLYFVALGINDSNPDEQNVPLGTIEDMETNPLPDTFYGNMQAIRNAIISKNSHAVICYITPMRVGDRYTPYQNAVVAIAEKYGCLLIDWRDVAYNNASWWNDNLVDLHPRVPMYNAMMHSVTELLSEAIKRNMTYMSPYPNIVNL